MTNKPMLSVELRALLERVVAHDFAGDCQECGIGQSETWKELRALLDKPVLESQYDGMTQDQAQAVSDGVDEILHGKPVAKHQGEIDRLHEEIERRRIRGQNCSNKVATMRGQLAERNALLREMRDLATAIPVLMLAVPNPHDAASRDKHIESVNTLIDRCDDTLSTSAEPKPRGEAVAWRYKKSWENTGWKICDKHPTDYGIDDECYEIQALFAEQPAPVADHPQCEECKGWGHHENHHEGGGTECGECGGSGNATVAVVPDVDELAQIIRNVDGSHTLGAGSLAEAILEELTKLS